MSMNVDELKLRHAMLLPRNLAFECGEGWTDILDRLFSDLVTVLPVDGAFAIVQVKEKFGGLRVYHRTEPTLPTTTRWAVYRLIALAEVRSFHTCERCGRPSLLWNRGFFTVCDQHADRSGDGHSRRPAVAVERKSPFCDRFEDERAWYRYDPARDDFVPCPPPDGLEGR
jgi:hypothetical protein